MNGCHNRAPFLPELTVPDGWNAEPTIRSTGGDEMNDLFGEVNGEWYHFRDGNPLLDERGQMIEAYLCLCFARSETECSCGAWDFPLPPVQELQP